MAFKSSRIVLSVAFALLTAIAFAQVPAAQHVVMVMDENSSFSEVLANMPWLVAQGNANGYASKYQSDNGGSLLDYLWIASGSCESKANCTLPAGTHDFNCNGNNCFYPGTSNSDPITDNNIFRDLNNANISWKVYAQSYAAAGGTPTTPDQNNGTDYYRRHNGATWYSDILNNTDGSAAKIVDLSQLTSDVAANNLPRFSIIVPDGNHDAHDCPVGMSTCTEDQQLAAADAFLSDTLDPILSLSDFLPGGTGLIVITFDECGDGTDGGCGSAVYAALIGPQVSPHTVSSMPYKHENSLRTMLDSLGLTNYPGAAATAADMSDFFSTTGSKPVVVVSSPAGGASLTSPVTIDASAYATAKHTISAWNVYVDSVSQYTAGAVTSIHPKITMSTGSHSITVTTWDTSGAYGSQTFSLTVSSLAPTVTVTTPTNSESVGSPVNIIANASPTAGQNITSWAVYVDGTESYSAGAQRSINANVAMSNGTHTVIVRAWDSSSNYGQQTLTLTLSAKPAVAVSAPAIGANLLSPFTVQASALPSSGNTITAWAVYLDGVSVYTAGKVSSIDPKISASTGAHTLVVQAWDSSGAVGSQSIALHGADVALNVSTPFSGAPVTSPVNIAASAAAGYTITSWQINVDSVPEFMQAAGNTINANLLMAPGTHTVLVEAWDNVGALGSQTITVVVP